MKIIHSILPEDYESLLRRPSAGSVEIDERVREIIEMVEKGGDKALCKLCLEIDGRLPEQFEIPKEALVNASGDVDDLLKSSITQAARNIESFHRIQLPEEKTVETMPGVSCTIRYRPIENVGLYIPGGTAPLLSTVLMTAIPASIAGCKNIIACTPPGSPPELLYTLGLFDIRVFALGGAQAVAAMAFGTESIPAVDKIFGPGNQWVTKAKMQLAGRGMAVDMPAGPSEVLVIADSSAVPAYVASDLLSQAEHGPDSQVILLADSLELLEECLRETELQLKELPRKEWAASSLENGLAVCVRDIEQAIEISNFYGPEHLILSVNNAEEAEKGITNAGSVFLGNNTPESAGDYASGTNHTLPTGGAARAWSGITTASFMKSITVQKMSRDGLLRLAPVILQMARAEQLEAHAGAVLQRLKENSKR